MTRSSFYYRLQEITRSPLSQYSAGKHEEDFEEPAMFGIDDFIALFELVLAKVDLEKSTAAESNDEWELSFT